MGLILRQFWPHIIFGVVVFAFIFYIFSQGKSAGKVENLESQVTESKNQVKVERQAVAEVAKAKEVQKQQVSNARKEVNDAYSRGDVPQRVRKFYID